MFQRSMLPTHKTPNEATSLSTPNMNQYPFGNFRDNPPWPLCLRNQPAFFGYEVQEPNIPLVVPPSFHPHQMDYPYVHYTAVPVLISANPFTNNFSFPPPPPPTRIPSPADVALPGTPFNPLLVPNPNDYFVLQPQPHQSELIPRHTIVGPHVSDAQFRNSQLKKQHKVQDERPTLQQDQFISEVRNTQYANTTVPISRNHDNVYNLQQKQQQHEQHHEQHHKQHHKQQHEQQQLTQQTLPTLSDRLQEQAKLPAQLSTVKHQHFVTRGMNLPSTRDSVTERYQTMNQVENRVIQHEEIDFPPNKNVNTEENVFLPNPGVIQTTGTVNANKQSEINEYTGVSLMQATSQEQENKPVKQQLPDIQQDMILNKEQDERHVQLHQHNTKPTNSQKTQAQFNQDKKEDKPRLQNNMKRNKSERYNREHHPTQPRLQHGETLHWQQSNNWPPQHSHNKPQYSHRQTGRQQFQQPHQTMQVYSSHNTAFKESSQDLNKPEYTPRFNTDVRYSRKGNGDSKDSESKCSKERKDTRKDPQEGSNSDDHKVANFNHKASRYYRNRQFMSTS